MHNVHNHAHTQLLHNIYALMCEDRAWRWRIHCTPCKIVVSITKLDDFQLNCTKSVHLVASKKSTPLQCPAAFRLDLLFLDVHATDVCIGHVRLFGHGHALHLQRHMFPGKKNEMN